MLIRVSVQAKLPEMTSVCENGFSHIYILLTAFYARRCQNLLRELSINIHSIIEFKPTFQEIDMSTFTKNHSDFFYRALAAVAITAPILLVFAAGTLPEGLERGELIVNGYGMVLAVLATALVLRAAYAFGFSKALKKIAASEPNYSVTA
jgi:hypothetical protein